MEEYIRGSKCPSRIVKAQEEENKFSQYLENLLFYYIYKLLVK